MAWELLAIWVIVLVAVVWFIRDGRRLRAEAAMESGSLLCARP